MSDIYSLPHFHVEVGGKRLTPATLRFLVELRVGQALSLPTQAELVFKQFKSLAQLGHLPKYDDESANAWLYGKLLVALLMEKLIHHATAISP